MRIPGHERPACANKNSSASNASIFNMSINSVDQGGDQGYLRLAGETDVQGGGANVFSSPQTKCCGTELYVDILTLAAVSGMSFMLTVACHEHLGHSLACFALGGTVTELGAFYVNCQYMSELNQKITQIAGPFVNVILGILCARLLDCVVKKSTWNKAVVFFLWHFFTVNLLNAGGYLMFSGVVGIGDLGTDKNGAGYDVEPEWLYRTLLVLFGLFAYLVAVFASLKKFDLFVGGDQSERVRRAQWISFISYISGGLVATATGCFNPEWMKMVLKSTVPSSFGGPAAMLSMMRCLNKEKITGLPPFKMERSWPLIAGCSACVLAYAIVFGRTLVLKS